MTQKMLQKRLSTFINMFISSKRKLNSKKGLCGAPYLDMLFQTKTKKARYIELAWNEKNSPKAQKTMNWEKTKNILTIWVKIWSQPRKFQRGSNLEDMLGLKWKSYDTIFTSISLRLIEMFFKWASQIADFLFNISHSRLIEYL